MSEVMLGDRLSFKSSAYEQIHERVFNQMYEYLIDYKSNVSSIDIENMADMIMEELFDVEYDND